MIAIDIRAFARQSVLVIVLSSLSGCRDVFGPEPMPVTTVSGRVHIGGVPLTKGWIEFAPYDGTVGRLRSAAIGPDGRFVARDVAVGSVRIHLAGPPPPATGDRMTDWYLAQTRRSYTTKIDIKGGENPPLDLDLRREAIALDKSTREQRQNRDTGDQ